MLDKSLNLLLSAYDRIGMILRILYLNLLLYSTACLYLQEVIFLLLQTVYLLCWK